MGLSYLFAYSSATSVLIPIAIGAMHWKGLPLYLKYIGWLVIISAFSDLLSWMLSTYRINTWPIGNAFLVIQFILLFLVLRSQRKNQLLLIGFFSFLGFTIFNYVVLQTPLRFNSYTTYLGGLLMIVTSIHFLYQTMHEMPVERIQHLPMLWIAFGVLIYFAGTLFLFLFNNYLMTKQPGTHQAIWVLHNVLNILKNIFFAIALWKNYRHKIYRL